MDTNGYPVTQTAENETRLIEDEEFFADVEQGKKQKAEKKEKKAKKSSSGRRTAEERKTFNLLVAILAVGVCLLCVSLVGMLSVTRNASQPQAETTTNQQAQQVVTPVTPSQPVQTPGADTGTPAGDTGAPSAGAPASEQEWLDCFNNAVNKLKSEAPAMTKAKQTKTADITLSNPLGNAYIGMAKDKYLSDEIVKTPIAKGDVASATANVSPDGASFVSTLTLGDIKSIQGTTDASGNYVVTIAMHDLTNPETSGPYGKIFQFMTVDDVMKTYAPNMGATVDRSNVSLVFTNCSATATITPDGKVVSYKTTVNANMILKDASISVITTDLDATLLSETIYSDIVW